MQKRLFLLAGLIVLLGTFAAAAAMTGHPAAVAVTGGDPDMLVPASTVHSTANWQAQPVKGAPASVPWANIRVNTDNTNAAQNEPFVAVDPHNAQHLVVGANNWQAGTGQFEVYSYASFDGGHTWAASQPYINHNASRLNAADPSVAFGADGSVYFAFVAFSPANGAVAVSHSLDGGRTWASQTWATSFAGEAADKPLMVSAAGGLYLYYQGSALYSRQSVNNGASWSAASVIDVSGRNAAPVVDHQGNVVVFYTANNSIRMARSVNAASGAYSITTVAGTTPLQSRPTQYRAAIIPTAGIAANGTMYVAWADGRNSGHGNDIMISRSADGSKWTAPARLNDDAGSADQLFPALSVGADGSVTAIWLDNRNDSSNVNYDIYRAVSTDGVHFGANSRVTSVSSNPNNDPQLQGSLIGDYIGLATGNGSTYAVWTDTRNNNEDIYVAPMPVNSNN